MIYSDFASLVVEKGSIKGAEVQHTNLEHRTELSLGDLLQAPSCFPFFFNYMNVRIRATLQLFLHTILAPTTSCYIGKSAAISPQVVAISIVF